MDQEGYIHLQEWHIAVVVFYVAPLRNQSHSSCPAPFSSFCSLRVIDQGKDHANGCNKKNVRVSCDSHLDIPMTTLGVDLPVQVVKEAQKVETELDKALLLVLAQCTEDLCGVEHVLVVHDPNGLRDHSNVSCCQYSNIQRGDSSLSIFWSSALLCIQLESTYLLALYATRGRFQAVAIHCPLSKKIADMNACTHISGSTNYEFKGALRCEISCYHAYGLSVLYHKHITVIIAVPDLACCKARSG